ncbi:COPII coat Sec23p-Sfb3p heterodimer component, partial [Mortierella sp. AD011]
MSGYPQQQQQRPLYPGQPGQQGPPGKQGPPGQGQFAPSNGYPQQQPSPFQRPQTASPGPYGNVPRPGAPIPGSPGVRPNNMPPGVRPMQPGQGSPARPPINGSPYQQHQQQYAARPNPGPPSGARPPMGPRPPITPNQQIRTASPLPGQNPGMPSHSPSPRPVHMNQTPTPSGTPGLAGQNTQSPLHPPQPPYQRAGTPLGHNAPPQQAPYQQQQQQQQPQQPTPPLVSSDQSGANFGGLQNQMSNMSIGSNGPTDQQAKALPPVPPQEPPVQSEAKPKAGARAKRVFAADPSAAPASPAPPAYQGQAGGIPPIPQPGMDSFNGQSNMQENHAQQPYGSQNFGQPLNQSYPQQPQQQYQQQQNAPYQQPFMPQQPMGQQQFMAPQAQTGSKSRIDPDQIPSPVAVQQADQVLWDDKSFITSSRTQMSPLASTDFMAVDEGNCNPRFFRMTTYNIPNTEELLSNSQLPMGLIIQPLAKLRADEAPIQTVDFGDGGPARCRRCKAYINPYMIFTNGGQRFVCNLCLFENEIEPTYFCNLDMSGRRLDLDQRPELRNGSIEFAVPKEYWNKTPAPAAYVFAIDVSWCAVQSGMLAQCVAGIKSAIWDENGVSRLVPGAQIGILTFDKTVHFYNLS